MDPQVRFDYAQKMPSGLTAKGTATKQLIIAGAAEVLIDRGVINTTLDDICRHAGISKSQLFHYFPDGKEELFTAVSHFLASGVLDAVRDRIDPLLSWHAWAAWRDQLLGEYDRHGADCSLTVLMNQLAPTTPAATAIAAKLLSEWHAFIRTCIEQMQMAGDIRPDIDPDRSASSLLAGIHGGVVMMFTTGTTDNLAAAIDTSIDYLKS